MRSSWQQSTAGTMRARTISISVAPRGNLRRWTLGLLAFAGGALYATHGHAATGMCAEGLYCATGAREYSNDDRYFRFSTAFSSATTTDRGLHPLELSDKDYSSYSGVGVIVCSVNGKPRSSTAFLVGAFDVGVTVAHVFESDASGAAPSDCVYNTTDSLGQIRERIPVSYVKSQWAANPKLAGRASTDIAVIKLSQPSRYAQKTMPLGRFSGSAAPVVMVGFRSDVESDTVKLKARGHVYEGSQAAGFAHDIDSRDIAPGAPVVDERTGVIIGIHNRLQSNRNTMITMNDWLEATLRSEIQSTARAD
jgi:Trypsin-like peptidase domain